MILGFSVPFLQQMCFKSIIFKCNYFGNFSLGSNFLLQVKGLRGKKSRLVHCRIYCICFLEKFFKEAV